MQTVYWSNQTTVCLVDSDSIVSLHLEITFGNTTFYHPVYSCLYIFFFLFAGTPP